MTLRYAFYVSGNAGRLKKLLNAPVISELRSQLVLVVSDNPEDRELPRLCAEHGIRYVVFCSRSVYPEGRRSNFSGFLLGQLEAISADYCFVYGKSILVGDILSRYKNKLINFHPSLLPAYKGLRAIDQAVSGKAFLLGNTAHFVVSEVDGGPVIMQNVVVQNRYGTVDDLLDRQVVMQYQIIKWLNDGRVSLSGGFVDIEHANYSVSEYIPAVEFDISIMDKC